MSNVARAGFRGLGVLDVAEYLAAHGRSGGSKLASCFRDAGQCACKVWWRWHVRRCPVQSEGHAYRVASVGARSSPHGGVQKQPVASLSGGDQRGALGFPAHCRGHGKRPAARKLDNDVRRHADAAQNPNSVNHRNEAMEPSLRIRLPSTHCSCPPRQPGIPWCAGGKQHLP